MRCAANVASGASRAAVGKPKRRAEIRGKLAEDERLLGELPQITARTRGEVSRAVERFASSTCRPAILDK
jgi:hypothetical protein